MGIMVKTAIPTGTGITRLVIPILSSGYSITITKQASKTVFQTAEIVKPHTKDMTPKKIPRLKGYLRRKATASFISDSDWGSNQYQSQDQADLAAGILFYSDLSFLGCAVVIN
ncbi:hypothetical protein [Paenibacillus elgii]|uniref:hypothetical protein n=1 Tax=Paenibacillus elgii TaxID=189691 RepID=UPI000FD7019D|nr:hypothetical protein [Paenibacillus elgii]NEN85602.1 hypothetical protein [Paenibacillus elgii]